MKKFIFVLVTLALTVPAWSAPVVDITCSVGFENDITISYNVSSHPADPNRVRAFALEISVDGGAQIETVECLQDYAHLGYTGYWVHPGSIVIEANGVISDYGTCVASGICTDTIIVEMGSLYAVTPPVQTGDLLKLTVDLPCNVTVVEEPIRGGVVMEDPSVIPTVNIATPCCVAANICATCKGDITGPGDIPDNWIMTNDMGKLIGWMTGSGGAPIAVASPLQACADVTGPGDKPDGWIMTNDMGKLIGWMTASGGAAIACPASPCP
jgi:hypothetical protein